LGCGRKPTAWLSLGSERRSDTEPTGEVASRCQERTERRRGERRGRLPPPAQSKL